jgi:hypothetical protein
MPRSLKPFLRNCRFVYELRRGVLLIVFLDTYACCKIPYIKEIQETIYAQHFKNHFVENPEVLIHFPPPSFYMRYEIFGRIKYGHHPFVSYNLLKCTTHLFEVHTGY